MRFWRRVAWAGLLAVVSSPAVGQAAWAHDANSDVYATVTPAASAGGPTADVTAVLDLEYDLLMKSAWLRAEAYEATGRADQLAQLDEHEQAVDGYVTDRFAVTYEGEPCAPALSGADVVERGGRPYASLTYTFGCDGEPEGVHEVSSALFPDAESFVHSTETIVRYTLDEEDGSAVLTAASPTLTTGEHRLLKQIGEFFVLGGEHLLFGLDHVLFLLALLIGARRLRDVVWTATAFTVAHSVTFLLAALGVVSAPAIVVEPVIAASIAVVAAVDLYLIWRGRGESPGTVRDALRWRPVAGSREQLTTWDRWRLPVVFVFGLVHGVGFAGALGIDAAWSWTLLWSLLSFNVGIEAVQLGIIALVFPLLVLLRVRAPRAARWVLGTATAGIVVVALFWVVERLVGGF
ncbi:HupE/UreJ family protein [Promicromonospora iranensis]|uniref:Hydrogenase/urease accessory protein HupE n=1 Tax=Promicromonospora iranensis TaxID=1105144 RepID=A0ABU2CKV1_9MICO|nr:HupE/UreJ family protein [Promicromonospora iranensis]MDR7381954.1 hydrogenase/urease accessory protein HupE [Promicromonospora iranensis]